MAQQASSTVPGQLTRRSLLVGSAVTPVLQAQSTQVIRLPRKVRVGLIGLEAHASEILSPLKWLPDAELVSFAEPSDSVLEEFVKNEAVKRARRYRDYRLMLDKEKLDVVGICNSNSERAAAVLECIQRGIHVASEKPLAIRWEDLFKIKQALEKHPVHLTMLLPMRFAPVYLAMKQLVAQGEIGEPAQLSAQKSYKLGQRPPWYFKRETYGGTLPWIGIHMVDLMRWISGLEFLEVACFQSRVGFPQIGEMENVTGTIFSLSNGGVAILRMDYLRPETAPTHGDDRLRIAGTEGVIEYMAATGLVLLNNKGPARNIKDLPKSNPLFVQFLEAIYKDAPPPISLTDIFQTNAIVLSARDAGDKKQVLRIRTI